MLPARGGSAQDDPVDRAGLELGEGHVGGVLEMAVGHFVTVPLHVGAPGDVPLSCSEAIVQLSEATARSLTQLSWQTSIVVPALVPG